MSPSEYIKLHQLAEERGISLSALIVFIADALGISKRRVIIRNSRQGTKRIMDGRDRIKLTQNENIQNVGMATTIAVIQWLNEHNWNINELDGI